MKDKKRKVERGSGRERKRKTEGLCDRIVLNGLVTVIPSHLGFLLFQKRHSRIRLTSDAIAIVITFTAVADHLQYLGHSAKWPDASC